MASARRFLPADPKDFLRSAVPIALLGLAAWEFGARWVVVAVLVVGVVIATRRGAPVRWTWASALPVAVLLVLPDFGFYFASSFPTFCRNLGNEHVSLSLVSALATVLLVGVLASALGADRASYLLRAPRRTHWPWIPIALAAGAVAGYVVIPLVILQRPITTLTLIPWGADAIVPAVVFAVTCAVAIELAFRGVLLGWSARVLGTGAAIAAQAVVMTLVVAVVEPSVTTVLVALGALAAGVVAVQTRSLAIPMAATAGLAFSLYLQMYCLS